MKTILSRKYFINTLLVIASTVLTLLIIECSYRAVLYFFMPEQYKIIQKYINVSRDDTSLEQYQSHPYLSYSRTDTVYTGNGMSINNRNFSFQKPVNKIRIACLGGSTTRQKYPVYLRHYLHSETAPPLFEVMDFGCDGWTLQESLINYSIRVQDFSPDIIILHHGANDAMPRIWGEFKPDYSNFRTHWNDQTGPLLRWLSRYSYTANGIIQSRGFMVHSLQNFVIRNIPKDERRAEPAPNSVMTYKRNLDSFIKLAKKNGPHLILADMPYHTAMCPDKTQPIIQEHNELMKTMSQQSQTEFIPFSAQFEEKQEWFTDAVHMTEQGKKWKAQQAANAVWNWYWSNPERIQTSQVSPNLDEGQKKWQGKREIQIQWNRQIPEATDFHVYVKEEDQTDYSYLGRTADGSKNRLTWSQNAEWIHEHYISGPALYKQYEFKLFAITPEGNFEVTTDQSSEILSINNRIIYEDL